MLPLPRRPSCSQKARGKPTEGPTETLSRIYTIRPSDEAGLGYFPFRLFSVFLSTFIRLFMFLPLCLSLYPHHHYVCHSVHLYRRHSVILNTRHSYLCPFAYAPVSLCLSIDLYHFVICPSANKFIFSHSLFSSPSPSHSPSFHPSLSFSRSHSHPYSHTHTPFAIRPLLISATRLSNSFIMSVYLFSRQCYPL